MVRTPVSENAKKDSVSLFIWELQWHTDYHYNLKKKENDCYFCQKSELYNLTYEKAVEAYSESEEEGKPK